MVPDHFFAVIEGRDQAEKRGFRLRPDFSEFGECFKTEVRFLPLVGKQRTENLETLPEVGVTRRVSEGGMGDAGTSISRWFWPRFVVMEDSSILQQGALYRLVGVTPPENGIPKGAALHLHGRVVPLPAG